MKLVCTGRWRDVFGWDGQRLYIAQGGLWVESDPIEAVRYLDAVRAAAIDESAANSAGFNAALIVATTGQDYLHELSSMEEVLHG